MNPRVKKKWTDALDSGEYVQCTENLKESIIDEETEEYTEEVGHCCLGVLTDLYIEETGLGNWVDESSCFKFSDNVNNSTLSEKVAEWAGLKHKDHMDMECGATFGSTTYDPIIAPRAGSKRKSTAAGRNDTGSSFKQIAEFIKRNL